MATSILRALRRWDTGGGFNSASIVLLLAACTPALALAQAQVKTDSLFMLAGTPGSVRLDVSYAVTLYSVGSDQKLKTVREIVSRSEGLAAVRDDMNDRIYVIYPEGQVSTVSIIHKGQPTLDDEVTFYPAGATLHGDSFGVAAGGRGASYLLAPLLKQVPGPDGVHRSLVTVAGDSPAMGPRVTQTEWTAILNRHCLYPCGAKRSAATQADWDRYQSFRCQGAPGGPTAPDFLPNGITMDNHVVVAGPEGTWIPLDHTPPSFPVAKSPPHGPTIVVDAATDRYFAFSITPEGYKSLGLPPTGIASVYVHDRRLNTWKEIKSAATAGYARRIFGSWLATIVVVYTNGEGNPENPGRENERGCEIQERGCQAQLLPDVRDLYPEVAAREVSIPGTLLLDNLEDGRRITLDTRQEDSEILDVRNDGLVLYRVNDSIFAAQIQGDKLSKPALVVKDDDVPEVHWVFWSQRETQPVKALSLSHLAVAQAVSTSLDDELIQAADRGATAAVQQLLQKGAKIEAKDEYGATALLLAARYGNAETVKLLLDKGAEIEATDKYSSTALLLAAEQGKTEVVKRLLERGANIEAKNQYGSTPLLRATFGGHIEVAKLLLDKHANLEARDGSGKTALFVAVEQNEPELVKLLLDRGTNIEDRSDGLTALLLAANKQENAIVKLLLERGANVNAKTDGGFTPLFMTVAGGGNLDIMKLLLEKGPNLEARDNDGRTVLIFCSDGGGSMTELVRLLLDKGANIEAKDNRGDSPLINATRTGRTEVVKLLLDRGANTDAQDAEGHTAFFWAMFFGKHDIIKLLREKGAE